MDRFDSDTAYFERRASEEKRAAERALDPRARQSHSDLAERYSRAARSNGGGPANDVEVPPPPAPLLGAEFRILP